MKESGYIANGSTYVAKNLFSSIVNLPVSSRVTYFGVRPELEGKRIRAIAFLLNNVVTWSVQEGYKDYYLNLVDMDGVKVVENVPLYQFVPLSCQSSAFSFRLWANWVPFARPVNLSLRLSNVVAPVPVADRKLIYVVDYE